MFGVPGLGLSHIHNDKVTEQSEPSLEPSHTFDGKYEILRIPFFPPFPPSSWVNKGKLQGVDNDVSEWSLPGSTMTSDQGVDKAVAHSRSSNEKYCLFEAARMNSDDMNGI